MRVDGNSVVKCQAEKLRRCLTIARLWKGCGGETVGMAERFGVCKRTILRDIALLRKAGYRLKHGDTFGWWRNK